MLFPCRTRCSLACALRRVDHRLNMIAMLALECVCVCVRIIRKRPDDFVGANVVKMLRFRDVREIRARHARILQYMYVYYSIVECIDK